MDAEISKLQQAINNSRYVVFFGGAGVSTESGIPDFRSVDGLYHQQFDYPPEQMLSHTFYVSHKEAFYRFYKERVLVLGAKPNAAHMKLARLEKAGRLKAVITQNIDGLHTAAGSQTVIELHGSVHRNFCQRCGKSYTARQIKETAGVPQCSCGGAIKPDVVLYEEALDQAAIESAINHIRKADLLIVGGTSLVVYPAAGLLDYFSGNTLALVNKAPTQYDRRADILLAQPIGEVFAQLQVPLQQV